ncbi:Gcd10p-domain-containing protein [Melanogaster broomeanus]|nr:Gcd10p-domain-containing protein [Melanogaster broomeanus]
MASPVQSFTLDIQSTLITLPVCGTIQLSPRLVNMNAGEGTSVSGRGGRNDKISSGHTVLFKLPKGEVRGIKVDKDSVGSFPAHELIGQPYGFAYEIHEKTLKRLPPQTMEDIEETDATNELINDGQFIQPSNSGRNRSTQEEIIKAQIEQHANYFLKTEYSKDKYRKRKEAKYSKSFETIEPTIYNICDYWFQKDQNRIRDIRPDSLSPAAQLGQCEGRIISINDADSPPAYPVLSLMNYEKEALDASLVNIKLGNCSGRLRPAYVSPSLVLLQGLIHPAIVIAPQDPPSGRIRSERQRQRLDKRKSTSDTLMSTRQELFAGEFDGLLVASEYDPFEIVEMLSPYLAGSASIVVQNVFLQPLTDLQAKMRLMPHYLAPSITESWLRRYQVLPGRTHPTMSTSGSGGFLLHAIKVYDDPSATAVTFRQKSQKKVTGNGAPSMEPDSPMPVDPVDASLSGGETSDQNTAGDGT